MLLGMIQSVVVMSAGVIVDLTTLLVNATIYFKETIIWWHKRLAN